MTILQPIQDIFFLQMAIRKLKCKSTVYIGLQYSKAPQSPHKLVLEGGPEWNFFNNLCEWAL